MRAIQFQRNPLRHTHTQKLCMEKTFFCEICLQRYGIILCQFATIMEQGLNISNERDNSNRNFDGFSREGILLLTIKEILCLS